jgi:hypothetical protein
MRSKTISVAMLCSAAACTTLRPVAPAEYIPKYGPDVVWVTAADKTVVPVAGPQVTRDTLTGTRMGTQEQITLPLKDVTKVSAKMHDPGKTAILIVGIGTFTVAMLYEYWVSNKGPNTAGVDCGVYDSAAQGNPSGAPKPDC